MKPVISCVLRVLLICSLCPIQTVNASKLAVLQVDQLQLGSTSANTAKTPVFRLEDGTPVKLRLQRTISSADAHVDDQVDFDVLEEIKVNDTLVIPKGSVAWGTVTEAQRKRRMARGGKLNVNIDAVRLLDGEKAPLRAVKGDKGGGHTGAMTGAIVATSLVFFPAAPLFLFMHGKDITIPKGTEITAYINGDMNLDPAKFSFKSAAAPQIQSEAPNATIEAPTVIVKSTPEGADITVDGEYKGSTPSSLRLTAGTHSVTVEKTGFKKWQRTMSLSGGSNITVDADLEASQSSDAVLPPQPRESARVTSDVPPTAVNVPHVQETATAPPPVTVTSQPPADTHNLPFGVSGSASDEGFKVDSVREGSPAAQIFLRPGDIILKIDDKAIRSDRDIDAAVSASKSGKVKVGGLTQTSIGTVPFQREVKVR